MADTAYHARPEVSTGQETDEIHGADGAQGLAVETLDAAAHGEQRAEQAVAEEQQGNTEEQGGKRQDLGHRGAGVTRSGHCAVDRRPAGRQVRTVTVVMAS